MTRAKMLQPLVCWIALLGCATVFAKPTFTVSEIEGQGSDILFCDLDGDHLEDAVLMDRTNLSIFFQDEKQGFTRKPQRQYQLDIQPTIVWPARIGRKAASLLLMTSAGLSELVFTNRVTPPVLQSIIKQPTIVPATLDEPQLMSFPLTANTGTDWPLLLVPVTDGLQVWQHRETWQRAQLIPHAVEVHLQPSVANPGYSRSLHLSWSVSDINSDGRDDLMVMHDVGGGKQFYELYLQNTNGLFTMEPVLTYTNTAGWRTWLNWVDINRDGRPDLIESTISDEPSFVPGLQSGKVLVAIYLADAQGRIPATPQQVFRKSDWSSFLPLVDVDGDGFTDLVLGTIPIDSRETVRNMITAGTVGLNLTFHFFRPGVGFPEEPDCQRNVQMNFEHDLIWTSERRLYFERFVSLNGDFNGDGKKDLLARDHSDEISVYFFVSRQRGFSSTADLEFHCPEPTDWWQVKDLNGDGISDLVVKLRNQNTWRFFISREK